MDWPVLSATCATLFELCPPSVVRSYLLPVFEKITPDRIDEKLVEAQVVQTMIEQLKSEGLKGEISSVKGLEIQGASLVTKSSFVIRETKSF